MAVARKKEDEVCSVENGRIRLPLNLDRGIEEAGGMKGILSSLPNQEVLESEASIHQALADPVRLRILYALRSCEMCPCVLKEITGQSDSKLSYHLSVLEEAGIISSKPWKKWSIVALTELGRGLVSK